MIKTVQAHLHLYGLFYVCMDDDCEWREWQGVAVRRIPRRSGEAECELRSGPGYIMSYASYG